MSITVNSGTPSMVRLVLTNSPFLLTDVKADAAHVLRLRYVTSNTATTADGQTELSAISSKTNLPLLPVQAHNLAVALAVALAAEDLSSFEFPDLQQAGAIFRAKYERELIRVKKRVTKRTISRLQNPFTFAGAELDILRGNL